MYGKTVGVPMRGRSANKGKGLHLNSYSNRLSAHSSSFHLQITIYIHQLLPTIIPFQLPTHLDFCRLPAHS